jgi:hypothetical protein
MKTLSQAVLAGLIVWASIYAMGCAGGFINQAEAYRIIKGVK